MKNNKDIQPGRSSARLADGATLYDNTDDSHVKRTTALETKMRQMNSASERGIDPQREKSTSRKRANKEVKPILSLPKTRSACGISREELSQIQVFLGLCKSRLRITRNFVNCLAMDPEESCSEAMCRQLDQAATRS